MSVSSDGPPAVAATRGPRLRKSSSDKATPGYFYQESSGKRGDAAFVSSPPGRNTISSLPWRLGVRLLELECGTSGETYLKLQVGSSGAVEKTKVSKQGKWRSWDSHTSLWVGDPNTDELLVKAYAKLGNGAVSQLGTPFKIKIEPYKWDRASGQNMPEFKDHFIPDCPQGGRLRVQLVCVQAKPAKETPKLNVLVGTWNVGNEPPPADLSAWLFVGDVDRPEMPVPPPDPPKGNGNENPLFKHETDEDAECDVAVTESTQSTPKRGPLAGVTKASHSKQRSPSSAQKKLFKKRYAQPPPTVADHENAGVSPSKFGTHDIVVVGCQEGDYVPRDGFKDCEQDWLACVAGTIGDSYFLMSKASLGQMRVAVFVRADISPATHKWHQSTEATGIGHVIANKGGVGVSVKVWDTSVCFINSHLAAHDDMTRRRNDDFAEIVGGCFFGEKVECVHAFHHLVWFGDLNYRCEWGLEKSTSSATPKRVDRNPPKERVRRAIRALEGDDEELAKKGVHKKWGAGPSSGNETASTDIKESDGQKAVARRVAMFETDQLTSARKRGDAFAGFKEGNPAKAHAPTFKVCREKGFVYNEQRNPAWCDRVLWRTAEGYTCDQTLLKAAGEIGTSDHKAVACGLALELVAHAAVVHFEDDIVDESGETPRKSSSFQSEKGGSFNSQRRTRGGTDDDFDGVHDKTVGDSDSNTAGPSVRRVIKTVPSLPNSKKSTTGGDKGKTFLQKLFSRFRAKVCCGASRETYEPELDCEWQIKFQSLQGKELIASDLNGYSDPYVVFFGNVLAAPPKSSGNVRPRRWRTSTIVADLNPSWRVSGNKSQVPCIPLLTVDPSVLSKEHLLFRVMDEDSLTADDPIGYGRLFLGPLADAGADASQPAGIDTVVPLTLFGRRAGELQVTLVLEKMPRKTTKFTKEEARAWRAKRRDASGKPEHK